MSKPTISRRSFIRAGTAGIALVPLAAFLRHATAGDLTPLAEDDAMAKALNYHADATTVDASEFPNYAAGQNCANCMHIKMSKDSEAAGCALFPGKSISPQGWCKVWTKAT